MSLLLHGPLRLKPTDIKLYVGLEIKRNGTSEIKGSKIINKGGMTTESTFAKSHLYSLYASLQLTCYIHEKPMNLPNE